MMKTCNLEDFLRTNNKKFILDANGSFLWEDFSKAKEFFNNNNDIFTYTVVTGDDDTAWLCEGWKYVNRVGYIFTNSKLIGVPKEGLRYW